MIRYKEVFIVILVSILTITSCKKEDIVPSINQDLSLESDTTKNENKSKLYSLTGVIDKVTIKKEEVIKNHTKKCRKISKLRKFIKLRFRK